MCGFLGVVRGSGSKCTSEELLSILQVLSHRGPDGEGIFDDGVVFLGHKRLSIIDLSDSASQPLHSKSHNAAIIYNGEIYNYKDLGKSLNVDTRSDTEVLLTGFLTKGVDFLREIRGIFSFAIYSHDEKKIYLYRDLSGVKPLYYSLTDNNGLVFSSEIKGILPLLSRVSINEKVLKSYIHLSYCLEPDTIYNEVRALAPGHILEFDLATGNSTERIINQYDWKLRTHLSQRECLDETQRLLKIACNRNLVSDVELNLALSGGIDSSLLLGYLSETNSINSITVKFNEDSYDETSIAEIYSKQFGSLHTSVSVKSDSNIELLNRLLLHFDQPYADSSLIPFYLLNKEASKFTKVLIGGDGGDEIHNGYAGFRFLPSLLSMTGKSRYNFILSFYEPFKYTLTYNKRRELRKLINVALHENKLDAILDWNSWFPTSLSSFSINPYKFQTNDVFKDMQADFSGISDESLISKVFFKTQLQSDFLRKADMMSMISGVEYRVPMLDEDLTSFSLSIPYKYKSSIFEQKKLLRQLHQKMYPPKTSSLPKRGFSIPLDTWLGKNNLSMIRDYLFNKNGIVLNYINENYLDLLFRTIKMEDNTLVQFTSRHAAYQRMLILYSLQLWYFESYEKHTQKYLC